MQFDLNSPGYHTSGRLSDCSDIHGVSEICQHYVPRVLLTDVDGLCVPPTSSQLFKSYPERSSYEQVYTLYNQNLHLAGHDCIPTCTPFMILFETKT